MWSDVRARLRLRAGAPVQVVAAGSMASYGLWLLNPYIDNFALQPNLRTLAALGPEWAWGLAFLASGLCWLLGMACARPGLAGLGASATLFCRLLQFCLIGSGTGWQVAGVVDFAWWVILTFLADWRRHTRRLL